MKQILLLTACALVFCAGVFAQEDGKKPEPGPVTIRLNLKITDANGNPVNNIAATDIKLYENDVEQKVTNFAQRSDSNVIFVMDNTGSMRTQLDLEIRLATVIANNLRMLIMRWSSDLSVTTRSTFASRGRTTK